MWFPQEVICHSFRKYEFEMKFWTRNKTPVGTGMHCVPGKFNNSRVFDSVYATRNRESIFVLHKMIMSFIL